jgi:hypothetical protein
MEVSSLVSLPKLKSRRARSSTCSSDSHRMWDLEKGTQRGR